MNTPLGRLTALTFTQKNIQTNNGPQGINVLRVHFKGYDGDECFHDLPNADWVLQNKALQFLAKYGYRPSNIEGRSETSRDCLDDQIVFPLAKLPDDTWGLHTDAMRGAESALKHAEWFGTDGGEESNSDPHSTVNGGGGDNDGSPNGAKAEDDDSATDDVILSLAEDGSDQGVNVSVQ